MKVPNSIHPMDELHNKAMHLADLAYSAERKGKTEDIQRLYSEAFQYEKTAAMFLVNDYEIEPTRSVYFRSAASLILSLPKISAEDFREAERMVAFGLSGHPPAEIAIELREVLEEIKHKYYQQSEVVARGKEFETEGKFVALNLKTHQFEFLSIDNQIIRGSYTEQLSEQIRQITFSMAYRISGLLSTYGTENLGLINKIY